MADDLEKKKKLIDEINSLYKKLGQQNPFGSLKPANEDMRFLLDLVTELKEEVYDLDGGVNEMIGSWKAIIDEVKAHSHSINASKKSLSSLSSIASDITNHYKGINSLSEKQLESLKTKFNVEKESLSQLEDSLSKQIGSGNLTQKQQEEARALLITINGLLNDQDSILKSTEDTLDEVLQTHQNISKQLGFYPKMLGGIDKMLSRLGLPEMGIKKALDETYRLGQAAKVTGQDFSALKTFGGQLKKSISGAFTEANLIQGAFTAMAVALKDVDKGAGEYAKSMNVTYSEALNVRSEMQSIAASSGDVALNSSRLQETLMAVGKEMGSNAKLNEADLITFTKLREQAGYTNEELMGIQKLSLVNNKTLKENTKEILGATAAYNGKNKLALNEKQILKDVNSASSALKLSLGGSVTQLTNAAAKAREFGLSLQQTEKIAESLLNFESSIEAELSAELLTGRNLNLEQARLLALNGQTAEAAAEIAKQVGTSADFARMNVIQQESIAKAAGMTRDKLAQSLIDRESLSKLGVKDAKSAQDAYNKLRERGMSEMEIQNRLGSKKLADQYEQQSAQDRFNQSVEKLKDIFVSLAEPILQIVSPIADMVGYMSSLLNDTKILYAILGGIAGLYAGKLIKGIYDFIKAQKISKALSIGEAAVEIIKGAWSSLGGLPVVGPILAGAAIGGGIAYLNSQKGDDVVSPGEGSGYGNRTLLMGKDAIQLNNQDTVIAGTGLFKGNQQQTTPTQDNSALIAEIRAMRNELNNRPVVVHSVVKTENNDVLASATNTSNRKTSYSIQ